MVLRCVLCQLTGQDSRMCVLVSVPLCTFHTMRAMQREGGRDTSQQKIWGTSQVMFGTCGEMSPNTRCDISLCCDGPAVQQGFTVSLQLALSLFSFSFFFPSLWFQHDLNFKWSWHTIISQVFHLYFKISLKTWLYKLCLVVTGCPRMLLCVLELYYCV